MGPKETFGQLAARLRKQQRLTLGDVARHLGRSVSYISDIEHDRRNPPSLPDIIKMAELLGVASTELLVAASSARPVEIRTSNPRLYDLATAFARRSDFTQEELAKLEEILLHAGENK